MQMQKKGTDSVAVLQNIFLNRISNRLNSHPSIETFLKYMGAFTELRCIYSQMPTETLANVINFVVFK